MNSRGFFCFAASGPPRRRPARQCAATIQHILALSRDTLPDGTYEVSASQFNGKRWTETGDTFVTVVS